MTHRVFACQAKRQMETRNVIDATWVRKRKYDHKAGKRQIKSRLCGRGFLDKQKFDIQRHSSTASRLSQKLIISTAQCHEDFDLESWDISTAFLQGLTFDELRKRSRELNIHCETIRRVYLAPLENV